MSIFSVFSSCLSLAVKTPVSEPAAGSASFEAPRISRCLILRLRILSKSPAATLSRATGILPVSYLESRAIISFPKSSVFMGESPRVSAACSRAFTTVFHITAYSEASSSAPVSLSSAVLSSSLRASSASVRYSASAFRCSPAVFASFSLASQLRSGFAIRFLTAFILASFSSLSAVISAPKPSGCLLQSFSECQALLQSLHRFK